MQKHPDAGRGDVITGKCLKIIHMAIAQPIQIRFERFNGDTGIAPATPPRLVSPDEKPRLIERAKQLLEERDAVLVAHYYVHPDLQDLAQSSGGTVSDSLEMARFGHEHPAKTVVVAGVRFMGETAKILNPEKRVLMPDLAAECSLDLATPIEPFSRGRYRAGDVLAGRYRLVHPAAAGGMGAVWVGKNLARVLASVRQIVIR